MRRIVLTFWDGRNAHQPQAGAAKQRIVRKADGPVACAEHSDTSYVRLIGQDNHLAIYPFTVLKVNSLKNKTLRIFQGCLTVQLSKCCVVVSLLFTGATLIYYHGFLCLSTTFLTFFISFFAAEVFSSAASHILPRVSSSVNYFFKFFELFLKPVDGRFQESLWNSLR